MQKYFQKQIEEISKSKLLTYYGSALCLSHIVSFSKWYRWDVSTPIDGVEPLSVCWPFLANCLSWGPIINQFNQPIYLSYLVLSVLGILAFLKSKVKQGYILLIAISLIKFVLLMQTYLRMGNYHYMSNILILLFLFIPNKISMIRIFLVGFYVSAGTLKLNMEWLSGAAMINPSIIDGPLFVLSAVYVIILEVVFSWGLLSSKINIRKFTLIQLIIFHLYSWHIVGYFYPFMMFCLLSIFIIPDLLKKIEGFKGIQLKQLPKSGIICLFIYISAQVTPHLTHADPSLTGVHRILALNMFDSFAQCKPSLLLEEKNKTTHFFPDNIKVGIRVKCDPVRFLASLKRMCSQQKYDPLYSKDTKIHFYLQSKRSTDANYAKQIAINDVCKKDNFYWAELSQQWE